MPQLCAGSAGRNLRLHQYPPMTLTMPRFVARSQMPVSAAELFAWHERPGAFQRLAPPWETLRILSDPHDAGGLRDGAHLIFQIRKWPAWITWEARHLGFEPGVRFIDEQVRGPMAFWRHTHSCLPAPGGSMMEDSLDYRLPAQPLSGIVAGHFLRSQLERMFAYRHARLRADLALHRHLLGAGLPPTTRWAISGTSGVIGSALASFLTTGGQRVDRLVRGRARADRGEIFWQPGGAATSESSSEGSKGQVDHAALEGCDVVVHLAGEPVLPRTLGGWSKGQREAIRASRVEGTRTIARAIAGLARPPRVLICASGIGFYGNRGDEELAEDATVGSGFLAEVSRDWEAACEPARQSGVRVVNLRIGAVMTPRGGALASFLPTFRLGMGVVIGTGRQWMSWIGLDDLIGVILHAAATPALSGPINAVSPAPVRAGEFARTLAHVLDRPLMMNLPTFVLRAMMGEVADAAVWSCRAVPDRLRTSGFRFAHANLEKALRWELGMITPEEAGLKILHA